MGILLCGIVMVSSLLALPKFSQALTMQELQSQSNEASQQPRVLGAMTPSPDINGDGVVNSIDYAICINHIGQNYAPAEFDGQSVVDQNDCSSLISWWFATR